MNLGMGLRESCWMSITRLKGPRDLAAALSALMPPAAPRLASLYLQSPDFDATCGPWPPLAGLKLLNVASEALQTPGAPLLRSLAPQLRSLSDLELSLKGADACQALVAAAELWAAQPPQERNEAADAASQTGLEEVPPSNEPFAPGPAQLQEDAAAPAEGAGGLVAPAAGEGLQAAPELPAAAESAFALVPSNPHSASTRIEPVKTAMDACACRLVSAALQPFFSPTQQFVNSHNIIPSSPHTCSCTIASRVCIPRGPAQPRCRRCPGDGSHAGRLRTPHRSALLCCLTAALQALCLVEVYVMMTRSANFWVVTQMRRMHPKSSFRPFAGLDHPEKGRRAPLMHPRCCTHHSVWDRLDAHVRSGSFKLVSYVGHRSAFSNAATGAHCPPSTGSWH